MINAIQDLRRRLSPETQRRGRTTVRGALVAAKVIKVDPETGKPRLRKFAGVLAALRPATTLRRAAWGGLRQQLSLAKESPPPPGASA